MEWKYSQPVEIIFGNNKIASLYETLNLSGYKNGLLVTDPIFVENGLANSVIQYSKGLLINTYSDITPNPTVENVDTCAKAIKKNKIEFIVALGGGSALDCAKAAASVALTNYSIVEFHSGKMQLGNEHLPLVAIPTTSGTGSEVTPVAVLSDINRNVKSPLASNNFYPNLAIIDPTLTLSVPKQVTASTGLDVLSHALEAFWSKNHQPICDALALHSARLCFEYLLIAYHDGLNIVAREKMSEASIIAGLAFGIPKTAGSHACSFPLTNIYHLPHGEACAFTLDAFVLINSKAQDGRLEVFAKQLGFEDASAMADVILHMKKIMGMKTTLEEAGISLEEIENLSKLSQHPNMLNNPIEMDLSSIIKLYKSLKNT